MIDWLNHLFAGVCGQDPAHTSTLGGMLLPFCQRCAGLYVGAAVAAVLHVCLRPAASNRFLACHGAFLVVMVPFGYHWVPQNSTLRVLTGFLFGLALVAFLGLPLENWLPVCRVRTRSASAARGPASLRSFLLCSALAGGMVSFIGTHGGQFGACCLVLFAAGGAAALGGLLATGLGLGGWGVLRFLARGLARPSL